MIKEFSNAALPRGIRNKNPGNIRKGENWVGIDPKGKDSSFVVFKEAKFGIRALAKIIITYREKYGLTTAREILTRYAPPNENDTDSYISHVEEVLGSGELNIYDVNVMGNLVRVITKHENGIQPYTEDEIREGLQLAGIV